MAAVVLHQDGRWMAAHVTYMEREREREFDAKHAFPKACCTFVSSTASNALTPLKKHLAKVVGISQPAVHITWYAMLYHQPAHAFLLLMVQKSHSQPPGMVQKSCKQWDFMGFQLPTSTGFRRIWSINSSFTFTKTQFSLLATPNKQYWNTSRSRHHHRTPGSCFLKLRRFLQTLQRNSCIFMYTKNYLYKYVNIVYVHKRFLWLIIDELSSFDSVSWKLFQTKTTKDYVTQGAFCVLWPPQKKGPASSSTKGMVKYTPSSWHRPVF